MRSMWKGTVSFGLVSIPINLYSATEGKSISFRQVHEADGGRISYKRICSVDGEEVPYSDIAKGYELDDGQMVILTDEDLAKVPVSTSKEVEVLEFLPIEAIDPIQYDRSYYLEPQKNAVKPYVLLRDALAKSGRIALVKIALRQKESLALLRVHADVLMMSTLLWPDEVRKPTFGFLDDEPHVRDQELQMAGSLIESMAEDVFDPDAYQDTYQAALRELIEAKAEGKETVEVGEPKGTEAEVIDLMSALKASLSQQQGESGAKSSGGSKATPKKAPAKKTTTAKTSSSSNSRKASTAKSGSGTKSSGTAKSSSTKSTKSTTARKSTTRRPKSA